MSGNGARREYFLTICLNPVIQRTLVFESVAKGEVNRASRRRVDASGKGVNVARVLAQSGRKVMHLTQAGGPTRDWFLSMCADDGIEVKWVESGSEIRGCTTVIDLEDGTVTELVEESPPVAPGTDALVLAELDRILPECGVVVVSGTKAAGFPDSILPEIVLRTSAAGALLVLDIRGKDLLDCLPSKPAIVKPNLSELLATWPLPDGKNPRDESAVKSHVALIAAALANSGTSLVVTRGSAPLWYWDGRGLAEAASARVAAVNPIGSGDAFAAGLAMVLAEGGSMTEAVAEGIRLGALNATTLKPGSILG
jgi:1-phosphofructokinase/tagatose 6-phosphate kinase